LWRQEKFCGTNFRRDAEKHTPEAYAPQTNTMAVSISEFGFILAPGISQKTAGAFFPLSKNKKRRPLLAARVVILERR
jgi:hypothetical protein